MSKTLETPETPETPSDERSVITIDYTRAKRAVTKVAKFGAKFALPLAAVGTAAYLAGHRDGVENAITYEEGAEEAEGADSDDES